MIARLQPIRDPMRQARKDFSRLLYDYRYYDAQLRPAIAGYNSALDWMDGSLTPIIDDLNKYSSSSADVLEALVRERFGEWANGIGTRFINWYGSVEIRIAAETKKIREWPRIVGSLQQPTFTPELAHLLIQNVETIQWNEVGTSRSIDFTVFALLLDGTGPADHSVKLKDAYVESASEGDQIHMQVATTDNPLEQPVSNLRSQPNSANGFIRLIAKFSEKGVPNKQFLEKWRNIKFTAIYDDGKTDQMDFDTGGYFPGLSGPHVTRDTNAKKE